jgi:peptide/nickel transport system permease protein
VFTGSMLAVAAAWIGGWFDAILSMILDVLFAFPGILLAVVAAAVFGAGLTSAVCALWVAYLPYVARVLRSAGLRERAQPYVEALAVQGFSAVRICVRHLLPNISSLIVAQGTIIFGWAMVDLAAISFLGLGVQAPQADWGVMIADGKVGVIEGYKTEAVGAALCIIVVVTAVSFLGERLNERAHRVAR